MLKDEKINNNITIRDEKNENVIVIEKENTEGGQSTEVRGEESQEGETVVERNN